MSGFLWVVLAGVVMLLDGWKSKKGWLLIMGTAFVTYGFIFMGVQAIAGAGFVEWVAL